MELKKVEVTWEDAWHDSEEITLEIVQNLHPITRRNVGYLLKGFDNEVVLAAGVIEKIPEGVDSFCDIEIIPRGIVKSIKVIKDD